MMVAEGLCTTRRFGRPQFRSAAYATSAIANNIPDLDPIYTWITQPKPLGSLLHHRGHTHTLPIAWLLGWLVAAAVLAVVQRRQGVLPPLERGALIALGVFGATLHITMDFGNNYGVHPFWPLDARWFYGDSIFIIEPLWLAIALPLMASLIGTRWFAWLLWAVLAVLYALSATLPFVKLGTICAMALGSVLTLAAVRFGSPRTAIAVAWLLCLGVTGSFVSGSALTRARLHTLLQREQPALHIVDVAMTPLPGNPLCWNALIVGVQGAEYRVLNASVAPLPQLLDAARCPYDAAATPTARVTALPAGRSPELRWHWSYGTSLAQLRELAARDCRFKAWLQFVRVPALSSLVLPDGTGQPERVASDLRYDRAEGLDFADLALDRSDVCPSRLPSWQPPRADLLRGE
jgi:inner membrane protein